MKRVLPCLVILVTFASFAADIIPVREWPDVLYVDGKQVVNPNVATCVNAGYRLLGNEPAIPSGKQVVKREIIQDPNDPTRAKIVLTCIDIPTPSNPETVTNVSADRIRFTFTTNGLFQGITWIDAPITNSVK